MATPTSISQTAAAIRATLIQYAEGADLERLSALYGVPMPAGYDPASWREALRAVALGRRGTDQNVFAFLRGAFRYLDRDVSVTVAAANPQRITAVAGAGTFDQQDVLRWIEIDGKLYRSVGPADVTAAGGGYLELEAVGNARFSGANWSASETKTAKLIPFTFACPTPGPGSSASQGRACHVVVTLFGGDLTGTPPSYLQPDSTWLLYDAETSPFTVGQTLTGGTSGASAKIRKITDNGTTGVLLLGEVTGNGGLFQNNETITDDGSTPGSATANGVNGRVLLAYDNETGGGFTLSDIVTGATSGEAGNIAGLQDDGTDGLLVIIPEPGNLGLYVDGEDLEVASTKRGEADGAARMLERPTGQPEGGQLMADEFEDATSPPRSPLYLPGSAGAPKVEAVLQALLAAGCHAVIERPL